MVFSEEIIFPVCSDCIERDFLIVSPDTSLLNVVQQIAQSQREVTDMELKLNSKSQHPSCVLVLEDQKLVGLLTERDCVKLVTQGKFFENTLVSEVMTRRLITCSEKDIQEPLQVILILRQHRIRHLPILNEAGQPIGIVTPHSIRGVLQPADILKYRSLQEVMVKTVIGGDPKTSVLKLAQLMTKHQVSCVVIGEKITAEKIRPLGIITERDILKFQAWQRNLSNLKAEQVMSNPLLFIAPNASLWDAHQAMQQNKVRRLVVVDEQGCLAGLVTQTTILQVIDLDELQEMISGLQQKVKHLQNQKINLLNSLNSNLKQEVKIHRTKLKEQSQRHQLLTDTALRIRSSLSLDLILNTTVTEVRQLLECHRVIIEQFEADGSRNVIVESVENGEGSILNSGMINHNFSSDLAVQIRLEDQLWGLLIAQNYCESRQW